MQQPSVYQRLVATLLAAALLLGGCTQHALQKQPSLRPLLRGKPVKQLQLQRGMQDFSRDAVWLSMLQSFALLRSADINKPQLQQRARALLAYAHESFADLRDPDNFSEMFSSDIDKPYRGRPYERVMSTVMLALLDMLQHRPDMALPALADAEFLSARWKSFAFGTDSPLIYALMLRCQHQLRAAAQDKQRSAEALARSVRLQLSRDALLQLLQQAAVSLMRPNAAAVRLAAILLESALLAALMQTPHTASLSQLLDVAGQQANVLVGLVRDRFEHVYATVVAPRIRASARVQGFNPKQNPLFEQATFVQVPIEIEQLLQRMRQLLASHQPTRQQLQQLLQRSNRLSQRIEKAMLAPRVALLLHGTGPHIVREGRHKEMTRIIPAAKSHHEGGIWQHSVDVPSLPCGAHKTPQGQLMLVLCAPPTAQASSPQQPAHTSTPLHRQQAWQLWSSSYQATTVMGRKFDRILAGRAQFRTVTEKTAVVGAWSSLFLFYIAINVWSHCGGTGGQTNQGCQALGAGLMTIAAATLAASGLMWLVGLSANPQADPRYVPTLFESVELLLPP
ncbi:MAG: hypothetical protein AAF310_05145 [Myxococcota bacterium]